MDQGAGKRGARELGFSGGQRRLLLAGGAQILGNNSQTSFEVQGRDGAKLQK